MAVMLKTDSDTFEVDYNHGDREHHNHDAKLVQNWSQKMFVAENPKEKGFLHSKSWQICQRPLANNFILVAK